MSAEKIDERNDRLVTKQAIVHALANALVRLGKGDWESVLWNIDKARELVINYRQQQRQGKTITRFLLGGNPPTLDSPEATPENIEAAIREYGSRTPTRPHSSGFYDKNP